MELTLTSLDVESFRQERGQIAAIAEVLQGSWRSTWLEWHQNTGSSNVSCFLCAYIDSPTKEYQLTDLKTMITYRSSLHGIADRQFIVAIQTLHCERQLSWVAPSKTSLATSSPAK